MDFVSSLENVLINLGSELTVASIEQQKNTYSEVITFQKKIIFNIDQLEHIDAASLQLMLAFIQKISTDQLQFAWTGKKENFIALVSLLGMKEPLKITDD